MDEFKTRPPGFNEHFIVGQLKHIKEGKRVSGHYAVQFAVSATHWVRKANYRHTTTYECTVYDYQAELFETLGFAPGDTIMARLEGLWVEPFVDESGKPRATLKSKVGTFLDLRLRPGGNPVPGHDPGGGGGPAPMPEPLEIATRSPIPWMVEERMEGDASVRDQLITVKPLRPRPSPPPVPARQRAACQRFGHQGRGLFGPGRSKAPAKTPAKTPPKPRPKPKKSARPEALPPAALTPEALADKEAATALMKAAGQARLPLTPWVRPAAGGPKPGAPQGQAAKAGEGKALTADGPAPKAGEGKALAGKSPAEKAPAEKAPTPEAGAGPAAGAAGPLSPSARPRVPDQGITRPGDGRPQNDGLPEASGASKASNASEAAEAAEAAKVPKASEASEAAKVTEAPKAAGAPKASRPTGPNDPAAASAPGPVRSPPRM
jgi:hypothetical protein